MIDNSNLVGNSYAVITQTIEFLKCVRVEETRRQYIWARHVEIMTALTNEKEMILAYYSNIFAERESALEKFYTLLHDAVEEERIEKLQVALIGILGIIQKSPLEDLAKFRKAWSDPGTNFVL